MLDGFFQWLSTKLGNDRAAYLLFALGFLIWSFAFVYVNEHNVDPYSSYLSRGVTLYLFNLLLILKKQCPPIPKQSYYPIIKRNIILVVYGFGYAGFFFYLPVNIIFTISSSGPLFVLILDYFIHKIKITKSQMKGVLFSSLGMVLVVNGNIIYKIYNPDAQFTTDFKNYKPEALNIYTQAIACVLFIFLHFLWAVGALEMKNVKNVKYYQLNFIYGIMITMFSGCFYPKTQIEPQNRVHLFIYSMLFMGLPLFFAQAFFSQGFLMTKNYGILTMTAFTTVIWSYVLKIFRYNEPVNWICIVGTIMIVVGIYRIAVK